MALQTPLGYADACLDRAPLLLAPIPGSCEPQRHLQRLPKAFTTGSLLEIHPVGFLTGLPLSASTFPYAHWSHAVKTSRQSLLKAVRTKCHQNSMLDYSRGSLSSSTCAADAAVCKAWQSTSKLVCPLLL